MSGGLDPLLLRDLYRVEARTQAQTLVSGLLILEQEPGRADQLEACMRAAHSLKGAARLVDIGAGVIVAHAMEELFVAAQEGRATLTRPQIDMLLKGVDLITTIGDAPLSDEDDQADLEEVADRYVNALTELLTDTPPASPALEPDPFVVPPHSAPARPMSEGDSMVRVSAESLNRLLDLAGEALVESRRLPPLVRSFQHLKQLQKQAARAIDTLRGSYAKGELSSDIETALASSEQAILACQQWLAARVADLDTIDHRSTVLTHRLYDQALMVRMRPFADGLTALPRMVRDIGNALGKRVKLEVQGADTRIDRDILERLDAPLGHLLRNAVDHGIEAPDVRRALGKPEEGVIWLEAHHSAGTLQIVVSDDGAGVDIEQIRTRVIARGHADAQTAERLSEGELLEFLFLPGFTMKEEVNEISGRGVGLDVVRDMLKQVGGNLSLTTTPGNGASFHLQLPLTLSVIRALQVDIGGEPYAFPFAKILRATRIDAKEVTTIEGRQFFQLEGEPVGLVEARQILGATALPASHDALSVVVLGGAQGKYGVVVDRFIGGRELVVQPLDPRLGKVKDIAACALMEDGSPLLIVDTEDMVQSMVKLAMSNRLNATRKAGPDGGAQGRVRRVLVVDDSFTVRELQRKLLEQHGYDVELAVDGMEGWNTVRSSSFDLVISDVDMPRMDGIELVRRIKGDAKLSGTPVMILSYKDREDDRQRGLDAGADYYLTKGSYQSDALITAVSDLIGPARS